MARKHTTAPVQEERESSESGYGFWDQWSTTSIADVERDTYGSERRSQLERELRAAPE